MSKMIATLLGLTFAGLLPMAAAAEPPSEGAGTKADVLASFNTAADKVLQLAEAIPQEKYSWAPTPEVRTVAQVFMHVAGGTYFLGSVVGTPRPEGAKDLEKETDKAKVIAALKASYEHARKVIEGMPESELGATVDFFGNKVTKRSILMAIAAHAHEHLGQAIAYARSAGVVPPWSKKEG